MSRKTSPSPPPGDIPPLVLAISNLRCPLPPPILNHSALAARPVHSPTSSARETVPAGGALLNDKHRQEESISNVLRENIASLQLPQSSLDYVSQAPAEPIHHKLASVHAHFYVDDTLRPKNRSRSGSASAVSDVDGVRSPDLLLTTGSTVGVGEQNANIDPRLPQDDGKLHVLLGVCGALSTGKIKLIIAKLLEIYTLDKIAIQLILTRASENFISPEALHHIETVKKIRVWRDLDEWLTWKARLDPVLHIELRRWADILIVCPLTANTLSKISLGLCDNLLTNVIRAWNTSYPILLAPAMVSHSYNAITTKRQLRLIAEEMPWIEILKPVEKIVGSYGDIGMGGMMDWNEIVNKIVMKLGGYPEDEDDDEQAIEDDKADDDDDDDDDGDDDDEDDDDDDDDVTEPIITATQSVTINE